MSPDALGGEGGAGVTPDPGYGAAVFDTVPIPAVPEGLLDGSERVEQATIPAWVSEDGSLIIGDSYTTYTRADGTLAYSDSQAYTWTAEEGLEPLLLPFEADLLNACVAADGSAALLIAFPTDEAPTETAYRWTRKGLESLPLPPGGDGIRLDMCDAAITQAALSTNDHAYVWELQGEAGSIYQAPAPPSATAEQVLISREGKLAVVNATTSVGTAPYRFDFTGADQPALGATQAENCAASKLSDDGTEVIGICDVNAANAGFYYDGQSFTAFERFAPLRLSADGSVVWGGQDDESGGAPRLAAWLADSAELDLCELADSQWQLVDSSADGQNAFVNVGPALGPIAQRCSLATGVESLPLLPGQSYASVRAISRDGAVQIGDQLTDADRFRGLAVLWDAKGARDVLAELKSAQVELRAERLELYRVWNDAKEVRILSKVIQSGETTRAALIRLPMR